MAPRWQPARAGLVNLWRYADETFTFHRGRLLLRGPNGSGKSIALELLLPFLLDADASPGRLTSAAKPRGGLYERIMAGGGEPGRAGFAWVEFCRGSEVFTVGARLRATAATRRVDLDFFTTSLAVGQGLHLLDPQRVPLSRRGLVEALGDTGRVHDSAEDHRTAVRETLFPGFTADRYTSVVTALLALRREKLSANLDLDKLSSVLTEALPPLDAHDLAVVAEGFERLDRRRADLGALEAELAEVRSLAARQRDYARAVVAGVAAAVRTSETRRDALLRAERDARADLTATGTRLAEVTESLAELATRTREITLATEALKASEAYRDGAAVADLRAQVQRLAEVAARDRGNAERLRADALARAAESAQALEEHAEADAQARVALQALTEAASVLGAESACPAPDGADPDGAEALLRAWTRTRRAQLAEVRAALENHRRALDRRTFTEAVVSEAEADLEARLAALRAAREALRAAVADYAEALRRWADSCAVLGPARAHAALPDQPEDPAEVTEALGALRAEVATEFALARRELEVSQAALQGEHDMLTTERAAVAALRTLEPPPPAWRSPRAGRDGAPLWRLVEPASTLEPAEVDDLEAALGAAGLLDAWVHPDGGVELPTGTADIVVGARVVPGRSLADRLCPLPGAVVPSDIVARVLRSIAVTDSVADPGTEGAAGPGGDRVPGGARAAEVAIGCDGTFRLGAAVGRGQRRPAELLGAAAQERRRAARLAELDAAIVDARVRLSELVRKARELDARAAAVQADFAVAPDGGAVSRGRAQEATAAARHTEAETRLGAARRHLSVAEAAVRETLRHVTELGARHHLPTSADELEAVTDALGGLDRASEHWARRARELATARRVCARASEVAERAGQEADRAQVHATASAREAGELAVRLDTLTSTIGAAYQEVLARIGELDAQRRATRDRTAELTELRSELDHAVGALEAVLEQAQAERERADADRERAHRRFSACVADGLLADAELGRGKGADSTAVDSGAADSGAGPALPASASAVLAAARWAAARLASATGAEHDVERASARVEERLHQARTALGGRVDLSRELADEGWWVLRQTTAGLRRSARELTVQLVAELAEGRAELAAEEERLFEQTLAGSVRHALASRIRLAGALVEGINRQLAAVRTSAAGVAVRLRWDVDAEQPDAVKSARSLLLRDPAGLTDAERAALQAFVRARVDQARADLEASAGWEARLRETLDYRAWHRFHLELAHRDWDGFSPASARKLQRLSTGERSIALHLPMLASIAAHYADEHGQPSGCPRLILLDELFAGVDTANRAQLFGTFTAWDLDAVFTSDSEWCQYPTLDGVAIHHLHASVGDLPVTSTRFTWDGRVRSISDLDGPAA